MGITKKDIFDEQQNKIAALAKAIGHPARVAIIQYLLKKNTCICKDIVEELPLAQATISQHLKALKEVGIIKGSIEGTSICYCLNEEGINILREFFTGIAHNIESKNNCC